MSGPSLDGCRAKLRRADEHRKAFDRLFGDFLDENPYTITFEFDSATGWHNFRWVVRREPPAVDLALIFGDMLTNLRGTLDYLAWQLVLSANNEPTAHTCFPVVKKRESWASVRGDSLRGVADAWADRIEGLQPYHRGDRPELHPLAILDHVNNVNKHRALPIAILSAQQWTCDIGIERMPAGDGLEFQSFVGQPIEHGAYVYRFRWVQTGEQLQVNMDKQPFFRVSFRDGLDYDWTNDAIFDWVAEALAIFEPAFES
jgi:hypothetical protein